MSSELRLTERQEGRDYCLDTLRASLTLGRYSVRGEGRLRSQRTPKSLYVSAVASDGIWIKYGAGGGMAEDLRSKILIYILPADLSSEVRTAALSLKVVFAKGSPVRRRGDMVTGAVWFTAARGRAGATDGK